MQPLSVRPSQLALRAAHWQRPATQTLPAPQTTPQAPQLARLVRVSTQLPAQRVWFVGHAYAQLPPMHAWPEAQVCPQRPQFSESFAVSTQRESHQRPPGQVQTGARAFVRSQTLERSTMRAH